MKHREAPRKRPGFAPVAIAIIILAACAFVVITTVRFASGPSEIIVFEAESAPEIVPPFTVVDDAGASGKRYVEIPQGAGAGIFGRGGQQMRYAVSIPEKGLYRLWARVYWMDGCSNSFLLNVAGKDVHFGEDSSFDAWHWVYIVTPEFGSAGEHTITLINREDGVRVDKFVLTKDPTYAPSGIGERMLFFGFDGGSSEGWKPKHASLWSVEKSRGIGGSSAYALKSTDGSEDEYSLFSVDPIAEVSYRAFARCSSEDAQKRNVRLLLESDARDLYIIEFAEGRVAVLRNAGGREELLCTSGREASRKIVIGNAYHSFEARLEKKSVTAEFDGAPVLSWAGTIGVGRRAGVGSLFGAVCFDNVIFAREYEVGYATNFYYDVEAPLETAPGWQNVAGQWMRSVAQGTCTYRALAGGFAESITGATTWSDYSYEAAFKGDGKAEIGFLFYYLDARNTYMFKWHPRDGGGQKMLLRIYDGNASLLAQGDGGYEKDQWYRIRIEALNGRIRTLIDGAEVFDVADSRLYQGKIGFTVDSGADMGGGSAARFWPGVYRGNAWRWETVIQSPQRLREDKILFCYQGENDHYALCRIILPDSSRVVRLYQTRRGVRTVIKEVKDFALPMRVYQYAIERTPDTIAVMVNAAVAENNMAVERKDVERFLIPNPALTEGRIGLVDDVRIAAEFDDVKVATITHAGGERRASWSARHPSVEHEESVSIFSMEDGGSDWRTHFNGWQSVAGRWRVEIDKLIGTADGSSSAIRYERGVFYDDVALELTAASILSRATDICLTIAGDRSDSTRGYRMEFTPAGILLKRNREMLASSGAAAFETGREYVVRLQRRGAVISGYCDGRLVVSHEDKEPLRGGDVFIAVDKGTATFDRIKIINYPQVLYNFSLAEWAASDISDWEVEAGRWDEMSSSGYRLFGEKIDGRDAMLWRKEALPENFAVTMLLDVNYFDPSGRALIRFCADKSSTAAGYTLDLALSSPERNAAEPPFDCRATLLKNGRVRAAATAKVRGGRGGIALRIERSDGAIRINVENIELFRDVDAGAPGGASGASGGASGGARFALGVGGAAHQPIFFDEIWISGNDIRRTGGAP